MFTSLRVIVLAASCFTICRSPAFKELINSTLPDSRYRLPFNPSVG
nr:MAG TPA: hypothetical protein [Caudoviricetes sp.]